MEPYPVPEHGVMPPSGPPGPGPGPGTSPSPSLMHEQHLQQLHQSIQHQQQQLHQQLTSGTSSISDLIGMLPQTASLSTSVSSPTSEPPLSHSVPPAGLPSHMSSPHPVSLPGYRPDMHLPIPSTLSSYSRHTDLPPGSQATPQYSQPPDPSRGETSISSIAYTRQGDSYVCSLCGKVVVSKAAITRHIQLTHEKKKPFECNICHRRFGYKNILMEHQNIHFGIKPYACTLCDKRFAARSNLFQHRLLHMKPFCCYICNKRFDRDDQLQRHLKLHPTANVLSCSQCPFTATNVEALNNHLQESHKLLTYDTRRHSASFDSDGDPPSQVVMSLPSPTLTSPDKSPGHQMSMGGPNMDTETMRRIDSICSQLATRGQGHGGAEVKQEPLSPGGVRFPPDASPHHHFPPAPMSPRDPHLNQGSPTSTISNPSVAAMMPGRGVGQNQQRLPPFSSALGRSYSNPTDPEQGSSPQSMGFGRKDMSPIPGGGMDPLHGKFHGGASPRFLPPTRRANSMGNMNPMGNLRHGGPTPEHVRSIADSTSNLTEFFSTLQGLVQRSQEIPELNINISKPKMTKEVGVQHNSSTLPGEPPSLEELLVYYESQGRLYRCQHCRISFEERGLYFLHKSLHGEMSPWQCSICHKICADRNDFHLHFVNQQHHSNEQPTMH
ncbi:DNA-binding protein Ikaros [Aplysia californica]|uniref:DNA-binding protein Ikaros n=2 Tax=Euthyneura TaxID=216307 RepID=A0ABM0K2X9_APLCA|nr:DNA-binding protein Ikaros [Aplysia californica]